MPDRRDPPEPIVASRRVMDTSPEPARGSRRLWLAIGGGIVGGALLVWLLVSFLLRDGRVAAPPPTEASAPKAAPAQESAPRASVPEAAAKPPPPPPAAVSVRFTSPDAQVQFELSGPLEFSPDRKSLYRAGESGSFAPGTYKIVASGAQLLKFEKDVAIAGESPLEYAAELCVAPKREVKELVGQVVEERVCAGSAQCQSVFVMLNEQAEKLVKDRSFRSRQCATWRAGAIAQPNWALDAKCDDGSLAVACRIEIAQGSCAFSEPLRSARGGACPSAVLQ